MVINSTIIGHRNVQDCFQQDGMYESLMDSWTNMPEEFILI